MNSHAGYRTRLLSHLYRRREGTNRDSFLTDPCLYRVLKSTRLSRKRWDCQSRSRSDLTRSASFVIFLIFRPFRSIHHNLSTCGLFCTIDNGRPSTSCAHSGAANPRSRPVSCRGNSSHQHHHCECHIQRYRTQA